MNRTDKSTSSHPSLLLALLLLLGGALLVRLVFFPGYMGSDEIVYTDGALRFLHGGVVRTEYIGSLRYGVDIPVAVFLWLFGPSVAAASVWGMFTSLLDVAVVFGCAYVLWGLRCAVFSGMAVAFLPLHVIMAGRMLADPPLVAFMSLSMFCFIMGNRRNSATWFLGAGLAVGASFWVKQAAILYVVVFPIVAIAMRHWNWKWIWGGVGALLMLLLNCLLMWQLQGDPFHVFRVSGDGVNVYGSRTDINDSAFLYFRYLFLDIRHTWLLGFLAVAGVAYGLSRRSQSHEHPLLYAGLWAATLIVVFSFTAISIDPLRFVMKQSNYMLLFTAPLCLLAGFFVGRIHVRYAVAIAGLYVTGGVALAGLAQQDIHVFRGNSSNVVAYAHAHTDVDVYASTNAYRLALFERMLSPDRSPPTALKDLSALKAEPERSAGGAFRQRVAILDTENLHWGRNPVSSLGALPACWRRIGALEPAEIRSAGSHIVRALLAMASVMPTSLGESVRSRVAPLRGPKPAYVFDVPPGCGLPEASS